MSEYVEKCIRLSGSQVSDLLQKSIEYWWKHQCLYQKVHPDQYALAGFPDCMFIVKGKTFFLEIKTTDYPKANQKLYAERIHKAGGEYWCLVYFGYKFYMLDYQAFKDFGRSKFTPDREVTVIRGPLGNVLDIRNYFQE